MTALETQKTLYEYVQLQRRLYHGFTDDSLIQ